ncbi:Fc.00g009260.m01.CDS01 [Cosmosporella sp. VM-42]
MSPQGRKIAIVGGTGTIGSIILNSLLSKNVHTITAISRADSKATFPDAVTVKKISYDDEEALVSALRGQDVLLMALNREAMDIQVNLIKAAAKAGVEYVIPTEFGSDPEAAQMVKDMIPLWGKAEKRKLIEEQGVGNWIAVVNNPWFDWSLPQGFWGIDVKNRKATLYNGGNTKINTTTLNRVGTATAALLSFPEEELATFKNKPFYIPGFYVTQKEMLEAVQRATNTTDSDWTIESKDLDEVARESDEQLKKGNFMAMITKFYSSHFREGYGGDYNQKLVPVERLGLEKEDFDEVVKSVVASIEKST